MAAALTISGNVQDALAAVARLERQYDNLENKIKRAGQTSKQAAREAEQAWNRSADSIKGVVTSMGAMVATGLTLASIVSGISSGLAEANKRMSEATDRGNLEDLKLRIQAGWTPEQLKSQLPQIQKSLLQTPSAGVSETMAIATELAGSGFAKQDIDSGAALTAVLKLKAGTNAYGDATGDPRDMVRGITSFLKATGSETPTAGDIEKTGAQFTELFDRSTVQMTDLKQLAGQSATLSQFGLSREEQMSAFAALTDVQGASKADTALRSVVTRLGAAGASKERVKALEELGLKPEDVEISKGGRTLGESMDVLRGKLGGKSEGDQNRLLTEIFGEEGMSGAAYLSGNSGNGQYKSYLKDVQTTDKYDRNVATFQASRYAEDQRVGIKGELVNRMGEGATTWGQVAAYQKTTFDKLRNEQQSAMGKVAATVVQYGGIVGQGVAEFAGLNPDNVGFAPGKTQARQDAEKRLAQMQQVDDIDARGKALADKMGGKDRGTPEEMKLQRQQLEELQQMKDAILRDRQRPLNANGQIEGRNQ